jgi:hypothetical protein
LIYKYFISWERDGRRKGRELIVEFEREIYGSELISESARNYLSLLRIQKRLTV